MRKIICLVFFSLMISAFSAIASKNNFQFQISNYHTQRQAGQTLDVYVRYAMKDSISYSHYPDYRELRTIILSYLKPTPDLPANIYWENIAAAMGEKLLSRYPLSGVSIQLLVHPNEKGKISEPGFHGPIYTVGDVIPLNKS